MELLDLTTGGRSRLLMPCLIEPLLRNPPADAPAPATVTEGERQGLLEALAAMPDPRGPRGIRYPLASLLGLAVCAVLAGSTAFATIADWLTDLEPIDHERPGFTGLIPVGTTLWRVLVRVDADALAALLARWLRSHARHRQPRRRDVSRGR